MANLSSAAWIAHDVGLATALGGTLFAREALHPALREGIDDQLDRDRVADAAWRRFSWVNLAAHGTMAATWFAGRALLSGRHTRRMPRPLLIAKDALIGASLVTGIASVIMGRILGKRVRTQHTLEEREKVETLRRAVGATGLLNLAANVGIVGLTTVLLARSQKFGLLGPALPYRR